MVCLVLVMAVCESVFAIDYVRLSCAELYCVVTEVEGKSKYVCSVVCTSEVLEYFPFPSQLSQLGYVQQQCSDRSSIFFVLIQCHSEKFSDDSKKKKKRNDTPTTSNLNGTLFLPLSLFLSVPSFVRVFDFRTRR
mmetsp:Transcript_49248/g.119362  ORF Transcript_49248/g.119362 Transcript_49248/m.119362 type:complete len:135 (-) Transcript_49248:2265-2669(-)